MLVPLGLLLAFPVGVFAYWRVAEQRITHATRVHIQLIRDSARKQLEALRKPKRPRNFLPLASYYADIYGSPDHKRKKP